MFATELGTSSLKGGDNVTLNYIISIVFYLMPVVVGRMCIVLRSVDLMPKRLRIGDYITEDELPGSKSISIL